MTDEEKDLQEAVERCESMWINICRADQSAIETVLSALRTAQARVSELEQDKARLDWLTERQYLRIGDCHDAVSGERRIQIATAARTAEGNDVRSAIDAAMKDSQQ